MRGKGVFAVVMAAMLVLPCAAGAQEPNQVTGLTATQDVGFTTLKWNPVAGATDYQIERTPVDANDQPTAAATVVGVWQSQRTVTPDKPSFAESGYVLGGRYSWRVRARIGTGSAAQPQPYSTAVTQTTLPIPGTGAVGGLRTAWESRTTNVYTSDVEEAQYTAALDAASDRMRVVELARTLENRPMNLWIIGYPKPPETAAEISAKPTYAINCNVHGNEASGRESCFTMARQLTSTEDPAILAMLTKMVVLMVPSINADGRAHNTRGNTTGQDLNRDHALITQNETKGFAEMIRDYTPDVMVDNHEGDSEDLPILGARHLNVEQSLFEEGRDMVNGWMYNHAAESGWWMGPYSTGGDSHEGILRNTGALKNGLSMLGEARAAGGVTRPAEGNTNSRPNENRKVYAHLWENWEGMRYFDARMPQILAAVARSVAFQTSDVPNSRTVLRGSYPWPLVASVGANPNDQPDVDTPVASAILTPSPCGYFIPEIDYTKADPDGTVAQRLAIHGIKVEPAAGGVFVPLKQPYRGLIAPILDSAAPLPMLTTAQRRYCFRTDAPVSGTVPATLSLSLGASASFGPFTAGVAKDYTATMSATVISTAGDATLTASDPSTTAPGRLVNGTFSLASPLLVAGNPLPSTVKTYAAPVSNDAVAIAFKQSIAANEPLRTGTYAKTLTFTLSTTTP
ncbi:M14 family zinc carboxypeptidase [Solirubrobacter ginsenosidimutans]|uniref:M14 family zinc carboxypeptidase n=1 Tax=Solirubrobacter ginsenosidimutans TaxID=490573 RepID=A0A9X3S5N2_9ACTN|nr:M14 family zinc carboxypeptidase [Solirubrobacter ginsenosidimutans]MDA0164326.1 M14 family zinc carboxypeptidase [Solirubrobacter ginsenosidimutans]